MPAFFKRRIALVMILLVLIAGCGPAATATPVPSAMTQIPPTSTPVPPTPTLTSVPQTATAVPPTATQIPPAKTPLPPTSTPSSLRSSEGGLIAFASDQDGDFEIWVMGADGSGQQQLTDNNAVDWSPAWSPDGSRIAFVSSRDGNDEIYSMNADGSDVRRLTQTADADESFPAWSPDGKQISFDSDRGGNWDVYLMASDGSSVHRLTDHPSEDWITSWSPDGQRIVFESKRDGNYEIYVMNADGSDQQRLTRNTIHDGDPSWSPDGSRISFFSRRDGNLEIYAMDPDGGHVVRLTDHPAEDISPSWSPDGVQIVFSSGRDGNDEIFIMGTDGSGVRQLTDNGAQNWSPAWERAVADAAASPPETAALRPGSGQGLGDAWTRPTDGMVMVYVPPGTFQMGSTEAQIEAAIALCQQHYSPCNNWYYRREGPAHAVSLAGFWIDQAEVTNAQYRRCIKDGVCSEPLTCNKGEPTYADPEKTDHPVVCVSWDDAQTYCEWAGARLPTEAEWEYAFRGEQGSIYPWGDSFDGSRLNYCDTNCMKSHADHEYDDGYPNTAPVESFPQDASWSGATGMSGNVSEWVADWFGAYSTEALSNPIGPESGNEKMLKGCSWFFPPAYCRGAARPSVDPDARHDYLGFRCAGSPPACEASVGSFSRSAIQMAIAVPQGLPPVIDGIIAPEEWESAKRELFSDGSELFLMHVGGYLYLGIRANTPGMIVGNIFVERGGEIAILHSSAALGTAVYQKGTDTWQQVRDFSWSCRDTDASEAAQAERAAFLRTEHWVAANARMGIPNELEYQIKVSEDTMSLAVVFLRASDPNEKIPWPTDLQDDCIKPTPGGLPKNMDFSPGQWGTLTFVIE